MYSIEILADSYKYFQQKYTIENFYMNCICDWLIAVEIIDISKSFINYTLLEIKNKILKYYNLEYFNITNTEVLYSKEIDNSIIQTNNGFTAIISLKNNERILFEDEHIVNIKKGELLLFCNDIRFKFLTHIENYKCNILTINLTGDGKIENNENDDWWLKIKRNNKVRLL